MPYVSVKRAAGVFVAALVTIIVIALFYEGYDAHHRLWRHAAATTGGDPERGKEIFIDDGCGCCHHLYHVRRATGLVGPPLDQFALRAIVAGKLSNTPDNVQRWIQNPQAVTPGTDMPNLHVSPRDARDITAFLYTRT